MNKIEFAKINMKLTTILIVELSVAYNKQDEMIIPIVFCVVVVMIGEVLSLLR